MFGEFKSYKSIELLKVGFQNMNYVEESLFMYTEMQVSHTMVNNDASLF